MYENSVSVNAVQQLDVLYIPFNYSFYVIVAIYTDPAEEYHFIALQNSKECSFNKPW